MTGRRLWAQALILFTCASLAGAQVALTEGEAGDGFLRALPGRPIVLPADHASHPATRTEWWYLTGRLGTDAGVEYGFQATWFRRALRLQRPADAPPLAVRDVLLYHGALSDLKEGGLDLTELTSRDYAPWARASAERLDVAVFDAALSDVAPGAESWRLDAPVGEARLELEIDVGAVAPLRHGAEPGLSLKGTEPGQASWYYSLPDLPLKGVLVDAAGSRVEVEGRGWFDHEFGSSQLGSDQVGWDWFSVALDDGSALMLYQLRDRDGEADVTSSGTLRLPDGRRVHLGREQIRIQALRTWTSPQSGAAYPAAWEIEVPGEGLKLSVRPRANDQELRTPGSTGVTYWEGLCRFEGERDGLAVAGQGFVELVGYAESIQGAFRLGGE